MIYEWVLLYHECSDETSIIRFVYVEENPVERMIGLRFDDFAAKEVEPMVCESLLTATNIFVLPRLFYSIRAELVKKKFYTFEYNKRIKCVWTWLCPEKRWTSSFIRFTWINHVSFSLKTYEAIIAIELKILIHLNAPFILSAVFTK